MLSAVQANISPIGLPDGVSLPVGLYFETILKSKNLKKYVRWITSNGNDPTAIFRDDDTVAIRGVTTKFPVPGQVGCDKLKLGNQEKARSSAAFVAVNLSTARDYENPNYTSFPGEVVMGTNGWWCQGGLQWDAKERQIVIFVAAPHFYEDGVTEVEGWLELKLKGELVRHWWGISPQDATGYAKVEVVYKDGTTKTATVSAKYVADQDWIDLRAYGYTYSDPALKVSLVRPESEVKPTPTPEPTVISTKPVASKKITCAKGKVIKKVSTKTCPKGFKKR